MSFHRALWGVPLGSASSFGTRTELEVVASVWGKSGKVAPRKSNHGRHFLHLGSFLVLGGVAPSLSVSFLSSSQFQSSPPLACVALILNSTSTCGMLSAVQAVSGSLFALIICKGLYIAGASECLSPIAYQDHEHLRLEPLARRSVILSNY